MSDDLSIMTSASRFESMHVSSRSLECRAIAQLEVAFTGSALRAKVRGRSSSVARLVELRTPLHVRLAARRHKYVVKGKQVQYV